MNDFESMDSYQLKANSFVAFPKDKAYEYLTTALAEETGELLGIFAKNVRKGFGYEFDEDQKEDLKSEIGDVLWNLSQIAKFLGFNMSEIANYNIEKLEHRRESGTIVQR